MADIGERKASLVAQLDAHRASLSKSAQVVRKKANLSERIKPSFAKHRLIWLGGAALFGLGLARLRPGKVKVSRKTKESAKEGAKAAGQAGIALAVLKMVFSLFRPVITSWATSRLTGGFGRQAPPTR